MKGVQCYELFGGIALKNHTFSFFMWHIRNKFYSEAAEENLQEAKIACDAESLGHTTLILTVRCKRAMYYHTSYNTQT